MLAEPVGGGKVHVGIEILVRKAASSELGFLAGHTACSRLSNHRRWVLKDGLERVYGRNSNTLPQFHTTYTLW